MADVQPFRGLRYNLEQISELSSVITPPYDVISPDQQTSYYEQSPHNIIRLEFGKELASDNPQSNKYTRAADTLSNWLREGILVQEECPAFYLTEHRFQHHESYRSYFGLIAAVRLEEFSTGRIRPTEVIMKKPAADRLNLLKVCRANLSPIMGIFDQGKDDLWPLLEGITNNNPKMTAIDNDGVIFNIWTVTDQHRVREISGFFTDKPIYIADGHHRYTTALAYRDEQLEACPQNTRNEACNFLMMTLISSADPGLSLLPTHRLLKNVDPERLATLRGKLAEHFHLRELARNSSDSGENLRKWMMALDEAGKGGIAFGLYGLDRGNFYLVTPRDAAALRKMLPADKPAAWRNLDVSLLHSVILQGLLGIDSPEQDSECISYSPDAAALLGEVDAGRSQLTFLLNPVPISSVMAVADAGVRMPPKSTYFYPKTPAGLVINPLF